MTERCKHEITISFRDGFDNQLLVMCEDCRKIVQVDEPSQGGEQP